MTDDAELVVTIGAVDAGGGGDGGGGGGPSNDAIMGNTAFAVVDGGKQV